MLSERSQQQKKFCMILVTWSIAHIETPRCREQNNGCTVQKIEIDPQIIKINTSKTFFTPPKFTEALFTTAKL